MHSLTFERFKRTLVLSDSFSRQAEFFTKNRTYLHCSHIYKCQLTRTAKIISRTLQVKILGLCKSLYRLAKKPEKCVKNTVTGNFLKPNSVVLV